MPTSQEIATRRAFEAGAPRSSQRLEVVPESARKPVWFNGSLVEWDDARVHLVSHVVNYGSGVFEGIRFYETADGPALFRLEAHLERLGRSMDLFGIDCPFHLDEIGDACVEVVLASGATSGYIRPQVHWGVSTKLGLGAADSVDTVVHFQPMGRYREAEGLTAVTSEIQRLSPSAVPIQAKVIGYYTNSYLNHQHAHARDVDEAVMLDVLGNVAEASSVNVFHVREGALYTPEPGFILEGITRASVLRIAADAVGVRTFESKVHPKDLREADEVFFTGTAAEIEPVVRFDGQPVGDGRAGPLTTAVREAYGNATRGRLTGYESWLTVAR